MQAQKNKTLNDNKEGVMTLQREQWTLEFHMGRERSLSCLGIYT